MRPNRLGLFRWAFIFLPVVLVCVLFETIVLAQDSGAENIPPQNSQAETEKVDGSAPETKPVPEAKRLAPTLSNRIQYAPFLMEMRPGFTFLYSENDDWEGLNLGLTFAWRFYDNLSLKWDIEYAFFDIQQAGNQAKIFNTCLGINYDLDRDRFIPSLGMGIGPLFRQYPSKEWKYDAVWHLAAGMTYIFSPLIGLGVEARYNFIMTDFTQSPVYLTLALRLSILF